MTASALEKAEIWGRRSGRIAGRIAVLGTLGAAVAAGAEVGLGAYYMGRAWSNDNAMAGTGGGLMLTGGILSFAALGMGSTGTGPLLGLTLGGAGVATLGVVAVLGGMLLVVLYEGSPLERALRDCAFGIEPGAGRYDGFTVTERAPFDDDKLASGIELDLADREAELDEILCRSAIDAIRQHTRTGRPLGGDGFVDVLEALMGRQLKPRRPGPKPRKGSETS